MTVKEFAEFLLNESGADDFIVVINNSDGTYSYVEITDIVFYPHDNVMYLEKT